ncbi:rod shape-determining protein MreC [Novosphingobium kunmingense]|uniref:Cell shape-determining protein MreC n=1 Tax=Novosphingobium kunmingense TaxID=1211806 RepID=A0A2N0I2M2_9SPHN|nr:rod shape-determining protein MreC [Novosphingobium kunmingense]PKB25405.1 rod shape-determining protein MreC [Novosphingobium kunmingense]
MAPPVNRRPGYSRRAQYGTFFGYVLAVIGAGLGVLLLVVSTGNASAFAGLRATADDAVAPVGRASAATRDSTQTFFSVVSGYFTAGFRNARLEKEVAAARIRLAEAEAIKGENGRLKAMLGLMEEDPRPVTVARLIASTSTSTRRFATLGAGANRHVGVGMPVRSPLGVVGRVLEVGSNTSRVLLITDTESIVPVRRASDGLPAYATGRADGSLQIRLINLGVNPLKKGDAFVTSGSGGLYRPNIAVAVVSELTRDGAVGRPLSDPGSTDFVAVDEPFAPSVALSVAPAAPAP